MNVAVSVLNDHLPEVKEALDRKEQVILLHKGKKFASLQPMFDIEAEVERISNHPAVGMWADRDDMQDPAEWLRQKRLRRREKLWNATANHKHYKSLGIKLEIFKP